MVGCLGAIPRTDQTLAGGRTKGNLAAPIGAVGCPPFKGLVPITDLVAIAHELRREVGGLPFDAPVAYVYNPLDYAWQPHRLYLERFGGPPREVLLVGMNPGPFGMVQTGIPFGDRDLVRAWLGIEASVGQPVPQHPKRPVVGFACERGEVSGQRLWGWARRRFGSPEAFFARFLVVNYCPLAFLDESGRNRTPDKLPAAERRPLFEACDRALAATVDRIDPACVLGIGRFAERRIRTVVGDQERILGAVPHPSPASPQANRGWSELMEQALRSYGIGLPEGPGARPTA